MFDKIKSKIHIAIYERLIGMRGKRLPTAIFTHKTRCRLLGATNLPGRKSPQSINDFRYDVRTKVKTALIDLLLFVEVAGKNNVNQVITRESLKHIFDVLLWYPIGEDEPDLIRAEIAQLLIKRGFEYIREMKKENIPLTAHRTIEEAIDLSNYLVELFKPESERSYSTPNTTRYSYY
jgi:hypothetical protein